MSFSVVFPILENDPLYQIGPTSLNLCILLSVSPISACFVLYLEGKLLKENTNSYLLDFFLGFYISFIYSKVMLKIKQCKVILHWCTVKSYGLRFDSGYNSGTLAWSMIRSSISSHDPHCYRMENNILHICPTLRQCLKGSFIRDWVVSFVPLKCYVFQWKISMLSLLHLDLLLVSLLSLNCLCWFLLYAFSLTQKTKSYNSLQDISTLSNKLILKTILNLLEAQKMKNCLGSTVITENDVVCWDKWRWCFSRHKLPY